MEWYRNGNGIGNGYLIFDFLPRTAREWNGNAGGTLVKRWGNDQENIWNGTVTEQER